MTPKDALKQATLYTDERVYTFLKLPPQAVIGATALVAELAEPFAACLVDKDEVSLMVPMMAWEDFGHRLPGAQQEGQFRLITFDIELDFDLVGFMAIISRLLADANVSLLALSAFSRDHVFVPADQFDTAWSILQNAQQDN